MLFADALALLVQNTSIHGRLLTSTQHLKEELPVVSLCVLQRILRSQETTGAWDGLCEVTSYAVLALASFTVLPWVKQLGTRPVIAAISRGKSFLLSKRNLWSQGQYIWVEKATYASNVLSEAYCLAAASVHMPSEVEPSKAYLGAFSLEDDASKGMQKATGLISHTPLFSECDPYTLSIAGGQAAYTLGMLHRNELNIFPRSARGEDKYMPTIPLAFMPCAALQGS